MASKHHTTSSVEEAIIRVSGYITKDLDKGSIGVFGGRLFLLAELVETNK